MRPYENTKLNEFPDVSDIQGDGRKSSVGKFPGKSGDYHPYVGGKKREATRRAIKRADKAKTQRRLERERD